MIRSGIAVLLSLSACTSLNVLPGADDPPLPLFGPEAETEWVNPPEGEWSAGAPFGLLLREIDAGGGPGRYGLVTNVEAYASRCDPADSRCSDLDLDGLNDDFELLVLDRLRPIVFMHTDDPLLQDSLGRVGAVGRVTPVAPGRYLAVVALLYSYDYGRCGVGIHRGDVERIALDLRATELPASLAATGRFPPESSFVEVEGLYTAAHEGTRFDASAVHPGPARFEAHEGSGARAAVFSSHSKHATYPSLDECSAASRRPCAIERCQARVPLLFPIVNAGEPEAPLARDLGAVGFPGEDAWSGEAFCGAIPDRLDSGPCTSAVRSKLVSDPFRDRAF